MSKSREEINRIAWETVDRLPQYPVQSAGLASGRPKSFPEFEELLRTGVEFETVLSMFLHAFYYHRDPSFFLEPPSQQLSDINRAALAGATEWLCHRFGYDVPVWTEEPDYFLETERDWFEDMFDKDFLLKQREHHLERSAPEFTRRNLIFPVQGLCRI